MIEVTCLGETMALFVPDAPGTTTEAGDSHAYTATIGGAESNVACALAALGIPARWIGRVGDDRFGRLVRDTLLARGVDLSHVETDPVRPTGLFVKELTQTGTRLRYYRTGSAASAMAPALAFHRAVTDVRLLHLSGITAALSDSCATLIDAILAARAPGRTVSFDVNWRPALWTGRDPALLLSLARRADLVFVGIDEAEALWNVSDPAAVRRLLPEPRTLVVKQGAEGATGFGGDGRHDEMQVPALPVDVVELTGAGDAFAAGFLAATLRGLSLRSRLRLGTLAAGSALRVRGDLGTVPPPDVIESLLACDDDEWRRAA